MVLFVENGREDKGRQRETASTDGQCINLTVSPEISITCRRSFLVSFDRSLVIVSSSVVSCFELFTSFDETNNTTLRYQPDRLLISARQIIDISQIIDIIHQTDY